MITSIEEKLRDTLIEKAQQRLSGSGKLVNFTKNPEANQLVCDLEHYPHAYVIACILDQQFIAEKVWAIPFELKNRIGSFEMATLSKLSKEEIADKMHNPTKLHRFCGKMSDAVFLAIQKIDKDYDGDASKIWSGNPSSATMVNRFRKFKYVGPKIATMATNILVRYFGIEISDYESIDISADVHVVRVFERLGLVGQKATLDEVIQKARRLSPEYPGIFDAEIWHLGREICLSSSPNCHTCYLNQMCQHSTQNPS